MRKSSFQPKMGKRYDFQFSCFQGMVTHIAAPLALGGPSISWGIEPFF